MNCSACGEALVIRWNRYRWVAHCRNLACSLGGKLYLMMTAEFYPVSAA